VCGGRDLFGRASLLIGLATKAEIERRGPFCYRDPMTMSDESPVIAYAPADLAGRRPPVWIGLVCLVVAAVVLLGGGFFGLVAGTQAVRLAVGLRDASRLAALPTRAVPPSTLAQLSRELQQAGSINSAQVRAVEQLLADPAQPSAVPTGGALDGYATSGSAGGTHVQITSMDPLRFGDITLDAAGRLVKADAIDWSTGMRTTSTAAADGTVSTVVYHRQHARPAVVLAAEVTVAGLAGVTGLLAVALAAAGVLLLRGRPRGWPLLMRLAGPLVAVGAGSILAAQVMWWATTIGNANEWDKATLWCLPGLLVAGTGAITLWLGRRVRAGA
jgi:hypothetical protein